MKTFNLIKWAVNILLIIGMFAVFNESESFVPNFVGLGCFILLIIINRDTQWKN